MPLFRFPDGSVEFFSDALSPEELRDAVAARMEEKKAAPQPEKETPSGLGGQARSRLQEKIAENPAVANALAAMMTGLGPGASRAVGAITAPSELASDFIRGLGQGTQETLSTIPESAAVLTDIAGVDKVANALYGLAKKPREFAAMTPGPRVPSTANIESAADILPFAAGQIGSGAPTLIGLGGLGALTGGAGTAAAAMGVQTGVISQRIAEETGQRSPGTALTLGILTGLLEQSPVARVLKRVIPSNAATEGLAKFLLPRMIQAGIVGAEEALTEGAQQFGERLAVKWVDKNFPLLDKKGRQEIIDAMAGGLLLGGGMGLAFGGEMETPPPPREEKKIIVQQREKPASPSGLGASVLPSWLKQDREMRSRWEAGEITSEDAFQNALGLGRVAPDDRARWIEHLDRIQAAKRGEEMVPPEEPPLPEQKAPPEAKPAVVSQKPEQAPSELEEVKAEWKRELPIPPEPKIEGTVGQSAVVMAEEEAARKVGLDKEDGQDVFYKDPISLQSVLPAYEDKPGEALVRGTEHLEEKLGPTTLPKFIARFFGAKLTGQVLVDTRADAMRQEIAKNAGEIAEISGREEDRRPLRRTLGSYLPVVKEMSPRYRYGKRAKALAGVYKYYRELKSPEYREELLRLQDEMPEAERELLRMAQNVDRSPRIARLFKQIDAHFDQLGKDMVAFGVIQKADEAHYPRRWISNPHMSELASQFLKTTTHARGRTRKSLASGLAKGDQLLFSDVTDAYRMLGNITSTVIESRKMIDAGLRQEAVPGTGFSMFRTGPLSKQQMEELPEELRDSWRTQYVPTNIPGLTRWVVVGEVAGDALEGDIGGRRVFGTDSFKVKRTTPVYAVVKEGEKKAARTFDSKEEAQQFIDERTRQRRVVYPRKDKKGNIRYGVKNVGGQKTSRVFETKEEADAFAAKAEPGETFSIVERPAPDRGRYVTTSREDAERWISEQDKPELYSVSHVKKVLEQQQIWMPRNLAKSMERALVPSDMSKWPLLDKILQTNAALKSTLLLTNLFHYGAFLRSYYLGAHGHLKEEGRGKRSLSGALAAGKRMAEEMDPVLRLGLANRLTLARQQEWDESVWQRNGLVARIAQRARIPDRHIAKLQLAQKEASDFLFSRFGAALKASAFYLEYHNVLRNNPGIDEPEAARIAAKLANDDFGGLHLETMSPTPFGGTGFGRHPGVQDIFRLSFLAPDWTESNIRTVTAMIGKGGEAERTAYRHFWYSAALKGMTATILANLIMAALGDEDPEESLKKAIQHGNLRWMEVDVTPLYKAYADIVGDLGEKTAGVPVVGPALGRAAAGMAGAGDRRKYMSIIGHFKDPPKFASDLPTATKHKMSVVGRMAFEFLSGTNWRGQRFTTLDEFLGVDQKGVYKTGVKKGLPKGGKDFHHLTSETRRGLGPVKTSEMPSFLLAQIAQVLPIQAQALVNLMLGEVDGWDATLQAAGVHSASPYRTDYDLIAERIKEAEDKLLEARAFGTGEQRSQILRRYRVELRAANNWHRFNRDILKLAALQAREEIIDEGSPKAKALEERVRLKQQQFVNWFGRLK